MLVLALGACTSGVTRAPEIGLQRPQFDEPGEKAGTLLVSLSEEGKADAKENDKFELATLKKTIRQALEAENLITAKPDPSLPKLEITVTSVRTRSGFTAVMFGFLAGNDHIEGDVVVRSPNRRELQRFGVSTAYALGGLAGGQDSARMNWLYESFAERMTEELTGKAKPEQTSKQEYP